MGNKKPRFFCDNCGAEVSMAAASCPRCGRFFASVRCPKCGFTGKDDDFSRGCPVCGYSAIPRGTGETLKKNGRWAGERQPGKTAGALPFWMYLFAALVFVCVLALLYNLLR
jgi:ssDNA-binding Zn-finger/Zn-ribbon topoisomerase 1